MVIANYTDRAVELHSLQAEVFVFFVGFYNPARQATQAFPKTQLRCMVEGGPQIVESLKPRYTFTCEPRSASSSCDML